MLSSRIQNIRSSATLALTAKAAELRAQGKDIISLSVGEPDFDTPDFIKDAAIKAIHDGKTKYTPVDGIPDLKKAIQEKFERENQLSYALNEIIVSVGAKQALYNLCQAVLNAGDEVIIPSPYWVSYPDMVLLAGGSPVLIQSSIKNRYKITAQDLEKAITKKTKLFFMNSPSNPSGMVYAENELRAIADVLLKHPNILIVSDDIYEHIRWADEPFKNILNVCPALKNRTIVINGVSKAYAMTGWRIGYAAGHSLIIQAMKKIQGQSTSGACSVAQYASLAAVKAGVDCIAPMRQAFKERHDFVYNALRAMNGIEIIPSDGTFYAFPNMQKIIERKNLAHDVALSAWFLNETGLAMVPGSAFGCSGSIRLSYALGMPDLKKAMKRIQENL